MKKKAIIICAAIAVVAVLGFAAKSILSAGSNNMGLPVGTEKIKRDTIITTVSSKGEVSLLNSELIFATSIAEVDKVLVEKNDEVKKGDVLLRYKERSREDMETQLREAELALQSARLNLSQSRIPASATDLASADLAITNAENKITEFEYTVSVLEKGLEDQKRAVSDAEKDYNNTKALFDAEAASQSELDAAEKKLNDANKLLETKQKEYDQTLSTRKSLDDNLEYQKSVREQLANKSATQDAKNTTAQRQISVEQAQLKVNQLRRDLEDFQYEILSPIDGTVTELNISEGALTPTDKALMEISDVENFVVKMDVNERHAAKIALGQEAVITGSVLGKETVKGKISKISSIAEKKQTNNGTERVITVEITVDNSQESKLLKPGFSLEAVITTEVKENVVVASILSTLKDSDGSNYVFVVKEDNTLEKRTVVLGSYSDMTVEILEGLSEGETVVSQPSFNFAEGMTIMPMPNEAAETEAETVGEGN